MGSSGGSPAGYDSSYRQPIGGSTPNPMGGGAPGPTDPFAGFSPQDTSNFASMGANVGTRALGAAGPAQANQFYNDMRGMQQLGAAMPDQATRDAFMRLGGRAPLPARPPTPMGGTVGAPTIDPGLLASIQEFLTGLQQGGGMGLPAAPMTPAAPVPSMARMPMGASTDIGNALHPIQTYP